MLGYGRDESAPTPCGVFRGHFVGVHCVINNPFVAKWQSVSSCRGPIYRARIYGNTHEMENGNAYLIMWKHVFGEIDVCI